ncbi:MAG: multidrug transporter ATP-binding protein, partial [Paenibacillus sp.]|nr:multidrug transporter ATP-binding protein [Paenibacillus sp.]
MPKVGILLSFVKRLDWFFRQRWGSYAVAISIMAIVSLFSALPPRWIGNTVDQIGSGELTRDDLGGTVLLLVGLALLTYVLVYIWITTLFGNSALVEKLLRGKLLSHLTRMKPSYFHKNSTGGLMALATNDVLAIGQTAGYGVMTLVNTFVGASVVIVMMIAFVSFKLMLAALVPLPLLAFVIIWLGSKVRVRYMAAQAAFGTMNDHALESISGIRVIRSYVHERADLAAFDRVTEDVREKNRRVSLLNAMFHPLISIIVGVSYTISIGYGSYLVLEGEILIGQLLTFNIYLGMLIWPMISFGEFINVLQRGTASADRLDVAFAERPDVNEPTDPVRVMLPESIEFKRLSFTYPGAAAPSLSDISFRLQRGGTLGIVGKTGSGKSTLLKQLLRQYPIQPGAAYITGTPIERISLEVLKGWIAYVPQEHLLLSKSIRDNIALGKPDATDEEIFKAVAMASFDADI